MYVILPLLFIFKNFLFIYSLFLTVLGLHCWAGFSLVVASGAMLGCGMWASRCRGFFRCVAWAVGHRLQIDNSTWAQQERLRDLEHRRNNWVHGLSCSVACGTFPDQGLNCVSCVALYYWAIRETLSFCYKHAADCQWFWQENGEI